MHTVKVNLKKRSYNIIIGKGALRELPFLLRKIEIGSASFIITNSLIKKIYGRLLEGLLKKNGFSVKFGVIPDTEKSKSFQVASKVIESISKFDLKRKVFIIAFGGGVTGDLAGFTASIYKRGIPYIQIPTTLLAQVDSSIGGKTGVDLSEGKNLVGAIYQPKMVLSDTAFLKSLDKRQVYSGLSEVIKYAAIKDAQLFYFLEKNSKQILSLKNPYLEHIVKRSSQIKAKIVGQDEREEKGIRTALNFGHTIGHAIESAGSYKLYNHGEAIALGMLVSLGISRSLGILNDDITQERIKNLIAAFGLPLRIRGVSLNNIINAHYRDKKFIGPKNRFVLLEKIGKVKIVENVPLEIIREEIKKRF